MVDEGRALPMQQGTHLGRSGKIQKNTSYYIWLGCKTVWLQELPERFQC